MTKDLDLDDLFTSRSRRSRGRTPGSRAKDSARLQGAGHEPVTGETVTGETGIGELVTARAPAPTPRKADSKMTSSSARARQARRGRPPAPVGQRWEDRVRRAAYYLDVELLDQLDRYCSQTGTNKSEVVREALSAYLGRRR